MSSSIFCRMTNSKRRRNYLSGACVMLIAGTWAAHAQTSSQNAKPLQRDDSRIADGSKTFAATCAGCHGLDGRGGERGPNIATRQEVLRRSDAELLQTLRNGIPASGMPAFLQLGDGKLAQVVSYLRTLQGKNSNAPIAGDAQNGESLFFGKARCSECHSINGRGGFVGSDLSDYAAGFSASEIKNAIVNPDSDAKQRRSTVAVMLSDGKSWEGMVRNEDNFSLQLQSLDGVFHFIQKSQVAEIKPSGQMLMPDRYDKLIPPAELDDIVGYLLTVARTHPASVRANRKRKRD
jgi:cytochrome c oxidase cbb3-type subunit III